MKLLSKLIFKVFKWAVERLWKGGLWNDKKGKASNWGV